MADLTLKLCDRCERPINYALGEDGAPCAVFARLQFGLLDGGGGAGEVDWTGAPRVARELLAEPTAARREWCMACLAPALLEWLADGKLDPIRPAGLAPESLALATTDAALETVPDPVLIPAPEPAGEDQGGESSSPLGRIDPS
ncbi:MAG: hypothetical protein ACJ8AO_05530 [Gemmatimonadaceae bacterium]